MLPNLIIIGAMKCGTTSLHNYLKLHPEIHMSEMKETHFFVSEKNWDKGLKWYKSHFQAKLPVRGEASPLYSMHPLYDGVPERIHSLIPDVKLIYLVRNPLEKILSTYLHLLAEGKAHEDFEKELLNSEKRRFYIDTASYYYQLEQYLEYFPESNILVVDSNDLKCSTEKTMHDIFRFLAVDDTFTSEKFRKEWHRSNAKRKRTRFGEALNKSAAMRLLKKMPDGVAWHLERVVYYPFSRQLKKPKFSKKSEAQFKEALFDDVKKLAAFTGREYRRWGF